MRRMDWVREAVVLSAAVLSAVGLFIKEEYLIDAGIFLMLFAIYRDR